MPVLANADAIAAASATVVAALIIAVITAVTTNGRQKRELKARTEGQKRQLEHARELADLADLRNLLDETAIALDRAVPGELVSLRLTPHTRQLEAKSRMDNDARTLDALHARLAVRLGPRHDITLSLGQAANSLRGIVNQIPRGEEPLKDAGVAEAREHVMSRGMQALIASSGIRRGCRRPRRDDAESGRGLRRDA